MTTKRKAILKTIAIAGSVTMDDLCLSTGLERKNMHDNIKACMRDDLCERIRDDVTGQPAYKLTPKGRQWLENDKNDESSCVKPQPEVGKNTGSKDAGSIVDSSHSADPLPVGNAVSAPPKPDELPVAACADDQLTMAGKTITEFCEWLSKKAKVRCPMNLREAKAIVTDLMQASELAADLTRQLATEKAAKTGAIDRANALQKAINEAHCIIDEQRDEIEKMSGRIAQLESNAELPLSSNPRPLSSNPVRYIVTDTYQLAASEEQACLIAIDLAKEIPIDTPVVVFAAHKAQELRINWRDA